MKRLLRLSVFAALTLISSAALAEDACTKITATGHPQYPVIAFKDGDNIVGAAPSLVEAIGKAINVPVESKYMGTWEAAQAAARDGKADMIFGIYYNDERATYLDYVQPAFTYDDVAVFVAKGKEFPFKDKSDLIGKKGVTNQGRATAPEFDAFMKDKSTWRAPTASTTRSTTCSQEGRLFDCRLLSGSCRSGQSRDQGQDRAARPGALPGDVRRLFKKSPCRSLADKFGQQITG
jgi:polar amino acid transport system substrate-binding protein